MLSYSADIKEAHCLKEKFFTALQSSAKQAEERLSEWIHIAEISSLEVQILHSNTEIMV